MSFIVGFEKTAVSTKYIANAALERVRSTSTNAGQRFGLHRLNPLKLIHAKDTARSLDYDIHSAQHVAKSSLGKSYTPAMHKSVAHEVKKTIVKDVQALHPKGVVQDPMEKHKAAEKLLRQRRMAMGADTRKALDDYVKANPDRNKK